MSNQKRILIVDDDHAIRLGTHLRLKSAGYNTLQADNGQAGVDAATEFLPDAIIMDVRMPVMDGVEALDRLKEMESTSDIPVVVVSASSRDESTALKRGARYFIRKPYAAGALVAALDSATNSR
jgi:CheY-like chemotaxis protein